jgi:endo-1,4-beta-xylanase
MQLSVASVLLAISLAVSGVTVEKRQAATSIDTLFKNHGKQFIGVAADQGRLSYVLAFCSAPPHSFCMAFLLSDVTWLCSVAQDAAISKADFGGVTPENSMKVRLRCYGPRGDALICVSGTPSRPRVAPSTLPAPTSS